MKKWVVILGFSVACTSCVTKGKYEQVLSDIKSKEKQQLKLEKQLIELKSTNQLLRDSAERIGG
ncbi:MAG: hypothetical protein IT244_11565 [Bacteroidia bacterium]|nr:hypothetical protein [Bacteroidia bacterium]